MTDTTPKLVPLSRAGVGHTIRLERFYRLVSLDPYAEPR